MFICTKLYTVFCSIVRQLSQDLLNIIKIMCLYAHNNKAIKLKLILTSRSTRVRVRHESRILVHSKYKLIDNMLNGDFKIH